MDKFSKRIVTVKTLFLPKDKNAEPANLRGLSGFEAQLLQIW